MPISLNTLPPSLVIKISHIGQSKNTAIKKSPDVSCQEKIEDSNKETTYLSLKVIKKILQQFLTCDRIDAGGVIQPKYTKEQLAGLLNITAKELERIFFRKTGRLLIPKINLPLISLYCETKFINQ